MFSLSPATCRKYFHLQFHNEHATSIRLFLFRNPPLDGETNRSDHRLVHRLVHDYLHSPLLKGHYRRLIF